ncbi:LPXTG cell wall anchor domain-containing protein [Lentzea terrae]|uniref:LPXTG cell wall anchor domain-containing protein n=1 Tax=Lentzea terrae TaxID=2200761 RepID=UPI000E6C1819|nr:LPXTG cell wall anchor domain-containing protein [Lentzea terrae]
MLILIIVLLVLWLVTAVIGFAFEGLIWLAIIGIVLFVGTAAVGVIRRKAHRR